LPIAFTDSAAPLPLLAGGEISAREPLSQEPIHRIPTMTSDDQNCKPSRFIKVRRSGRKRRRPDPAISIDGERLKNVLNRLEGLSGE